jgi:hypothetical protein
MCGLIMHAQSFVIEHLQGRHRKQPPTFSFRGRHANFRGSKLPLNSSRTTKTEPLYFGLTVGTKVSVKLAILLPLNPQPNP